MKELRIEAEAVLELIADELAKAGVKSTIDYEHRQMGQHDFGFLVPVDLDDNEAVTKAVMAITKQAGGKPIIFSRVVVPKGVPAKFATNLHNKKETIVACVISAWDPMENKSIRRLDFLLKIA